MAANAKGDQCSMEQHSDVCGSQLSQQRPDACLSYTLKVVRSTLLGLLDKYLGTPDAKWGICSEAYL